MSAAWIDAPGALPVPSDTEIIGLDTEFMRRNTFYPKLALIQVAHADDHWLLDPLSYDAGPDLRRLFAGRTCVMHSASEDLEALAPLMGGQPVALFDTQIAAALCGMGSAVSYQKLVAALLAIDLGKSETRSNWLARPLSAGQLEYAEQDVAYLQAVHDQLREQLQRRGRLAWHTEDCRRLVQKVNRASTMVDPQPQRAYSGACRWPREAQARLRRILRWLDATARDIDRPKPWVLDNAQALALARQPPRNARELFERVKGQRALRSPQRHQLLTVVQAPTTAEELAGLAPIPGAPKGTAKHAVTAMRQAVRHTAARLDIPPGLLCPRRAIDQFAATHQWPESLQGWREEVLRVELTCLLPESTATPLQVRALG
jgi:ribonuclease D